MAKQTIYLKDEIEDKIREVSNNEGRPISEIIRRRIEASFKQEELVNRLEKKIDAIFSMFELLSCELGYIAGATRASTKNMEGIRHEGEKFENIVRHTTSILKKGFERGDGSHESEV